MKTNPTNLTKEEKDFLRNLFPQLKNEFYFKHYTRKLGDKFETKFFIENNRLFVLAYNDETAMEFKPYHENGKLTSTEKGMNLFSKEIDVNEYVFLNYE